MADMVDVMRRVAMETQANGKPAAVLFGEVESEEPLEIRVEQKLLLKKEQLILTRSVTDHSVPVSVFWTTGSADGHTHDIAGSKALTVKGALKTGEKVLLLRQPGGQKFVVWDRVVSE